MSVGGALGAVVSKWRIRHELFTDASIDGSTFLNGVCRHEPGFTPPIPRLHFLNGVCRHEQCI